MKPMNSEALKGVLEKLVKIGQEKVKKSESLLCSLNIKDDMIRIAAKQIVMDPIEKRLRSGYVRTISKEAQPTAAAFPPTEEELKKKREAKPGSVPPKYPSGSETTTPYVGETHGGDQTPASITLSSINKKAEQEGASPEQIAESFINGNISWVREQIGGDIRLFNAVLTVLEEMGNPYDSVKSFRRTMTASLHRKAVPTCSKCGGMMQKSTDTTGKTQFYCPACDQLSQEFTASSHNYIRKCGCSKCQALAKKYSSSKLTEVIQQLKKEDRTMIDLRDITMMLNQGGQQSSFDIENLCKTLGDNGITLFKMADSGELSDGSGFTTMTVPDNIEQESESVAQFSPEELEMGMKVEMEHKDTMAEIRQSIEGGEQLSDEEIAKMIAEDHLKEDKEYYTKLKQVEGSLNVIAKSVSEIKDDLEHARESRSYAIERGQEKDLTPEEKEKYQKTKKKWEKEIDKLDRELSRAMKQERKKERDEAKVEKEQEQTQAQTQTSAEAGMNNEMIVVAQEPLTEPTFEMEKWLSPAEYQEVERLVDLRAKSWGAIADREERNIQEGLPNYSNIDYSEVEVLNTKIKQYQELSKSRKSGEELPTADKPEGEMPPMGEEMGIQPPGGPEEGVLSKKPEPLPEFASQRNRLVKKGIIVSVYNRKYEATPVWNMEGEKMKMEGYAVSENGARLFNLKADKQMNEYELQEAIANKLASLKKNMERTAVTCQDFPEICKNCKELIVPSGYQELTFMDHKVKPFCAISDGLQKIGFRYSFARECRGYDPILKEITQEVEKPAETIFEKLKERGEKPILKKEGSYEKVKELVKKETDESDTERGKKICEKCVSQGYFAPIGTVHPAHDYHTLWQIPFTEVEHNPKGVCLPKNNLSLQSRPDSGENQFDTEKNRIVKEDKKK